jgi:hypothetical protein
VNARARMRWLAVLPLAALFALGCSRYPGRDSQWVAEAERRHALADQELQAGNAPGAREALLGIVDGRAPADVPADDRRAVLQDTYFRLAELDLAAHDPKAALADADRGLALGRATDLFVANLLVVRGAANEALDDGPAAAADYHAALMINDRLLAEALHGSGDARPAGEGTSP